MPQGPPVDFQAAAWALAAQDLRRTSRRHTIHAFSLGVKRAQMDLRASDLYDPRAQEFAALFPYRSIGSLTRTGAEVTRATLIEAIRDGVGTAETARRLDKALMGRVGTVEVIARTETNRAANWGRFSGWRTSGLVKEKEFIATLDERVAQDHLEAHGEVVPIDSPFSRGAAEGFLMPPLRPNCRCTAAPITRFTDKGRSTDQVDDDREAAEEWAEARGFGRQAQVAAIKGVGQAEDEAVAAWTADWRSAVRRVRRLLDAHPMATP